MKRKHKLYKKPRKMYEVERIKEENALVEKYALKNKREIWKTVAKINYYRQRAKSLAYAPKEEIEVLFKKLNKIGIKVSSISDILDMKIEDLLERRLPTIIFKKNLANSIKQARQLVVHRKVLINNRIVNSPSYLVKIGEEDTIKLKNNIEIKKNQDKATKKILSAETEKEKISELA